MVSFELTTAGFPFITDVGTTGHLNRTLGRHLGSELSPLQLFFVGRLTQALADEEEWIIMAATDLVGAEGHRHHGIDIHIKDADVCWF